MTDAGSTRFRDALAHRDFRLMSVSFAVDQLGNWASSVVLFVYVFDRTGSATYLAITTAVRWAPALVLSGYAGVLADRYDRALVMRVSALLSFALSAGMAVVVVVDGPVAVLLLLAGLLGISSSPYGPAAGALTADVVPERDLAAANALYSLLENLTVVLGPLVGAALLAAGAPVLGFSLNAASFLVAASVVSRLRTQSRGDAGARGESTLVQIGDGFRALVGDAVARTLVAFMFLDTAIYGATTILYIPVSEHAGTGSNGYGYLLAGQALGGVLAASVANRMSSRRRLAPVIVGGLLTLALPFAVLAAVTDAVIAFLLQVVSGAGMIAIDIIALTALQRDLPRERLSRVLGLVDALMLGASLLGSIGTATLLHVTGLAPTLLVIGLGFSAVAVAISRPLLTADRRSAASYDEIAARVDLLQQLELLGPAPRPALERMALAAAEVSAAAGEVVVREGEPSDALWVVLSGQLDVSVDGVPVNSMGPEEYFGEIGLLHGLPRTATVTASGACTLLRIPGEEFVAALDPYGASSSLRNLATARLARRPTQSYHSKHPEAR